MDDDKLDACPVCGYPDEGVPETYEICSCCGVQFGHEDSNRSHESLRQDWIDRGMPWFHPSVSPSAGWAPVAQLRVFEPR